MKKALYSIVVIFLLLLLTYSCYGLYEPIVYDANGLQLNTQTMNCPKNQYPVLDNWYCAPDRNSTQRLGAISKTLVSTAYLTNEPQVGRGRGLYQFYYSSSGNALSYLLVGLCTIEYSNARLFAYNVNSPAWLTLTDQFGIPVNYSPYHFTFEQNYDGFRAVDTAYITNGDFFTLFRKWFSSSLQLAELPLMKDVGQSPLTLTGIATWTAGSINVTGGGTLFTSEARKGAWIRKNSNSPWYEVDNVINDTMLQLRNAYQETSSWEGGQRAQTTDELPLFILFWKSRLWLYDIIYGSGGIGYGFSRLGCSGTISSATPAGLETFTGSDAGYLDVPGAGVYGTGLANTDNYLFCFKDNNYVVYAHNSSLMPPVEEVKRWNYGTTCPRTIQRIDDALIYYTGTEVRLTNGFSDVSISDDIKSDLRNFHRTGSLMTFFSLSSTDNNYPSAIYDEINRIYHLYLPDAATGTCIEFSYDIDRKIWLGQDKANNVGVPMKLYNTTTQTQANIIYQPVTSSNEIFQISQTTGTQVTGEIQSADLSFGDTKRQKKINWIEFWVHLGGADTAYPKNITNEATLAFNYYKDGALALSTPLYVTINNYENSSNYYKKVRVNVNAICTYFRWDLQDIASMPIYVSASTPEAIDQSQTLTSESAYYSSAKQTVTKGAGRNLTGISVKAGFAGGLGATYETKVDVWTWPDITVRPLAGGALTTLIGTSDTYSRVYTAGTTVEEWEDYTFSPPLNIETKQYYMFRYFISSQNDLGLNQKRIFTRSNYPYSGGLCSIGTGDRALAFRTRYNNGGTSQGALSIIGGNISYDYVDTP